MKKIKLISVLMIFVFVLMTGTTGFAVDSASSSVTVFNYTYTYYSYIKDWNSESLVARTSVSTIETVPAGYIGIKSRLYSESGSLMASSEWSYNKSSCVSFDSPIYYKANSGAYYYSKGEVKLYNGNGYSTYISKASPNLSLSSRKYNLVANNNEPEIKINEYGEIYGSEIFLEEIGVEPDLILAIGENGLEGYVKSEELERNLVVHPNDIIDQNRASRTISLYKSDGKTIIGTFIIQNNETEMIQK